MYLRFVRTDIDERQLKEARSYYQNRVLPALEKAEGCRYALLLQPTTPGSSSISMTLWHHREQALSWEQSDAYHRLLREAPPLTPEVERSSAATLPWSQEAEEGPVAITEGYTVEAGEQTLRAGDPESGLFLRIVLLRVREDGWNELMRLYEREVVPALLAMRGCSTAFLAQGLEDPDRGLSVSIWDREEDAIRYELSGTFDALTRKLRSTLTATRQWQTALTSEGVAEGNPPTVGYRLIVGRRY